MRLRRPRTEFQGYVNFLTVIGQEKVEVYAMAELTVSEVLTAFDALKHDCHAVAAAPAEAKFNPLDLWSLAKLVSNMVAHAKLLANSEEAQAVLADAMEFMALFRKLFLGGADPVPDNGGVV